MNESEHLNMAFHSFIELPLLVGRGGALVESMPFEGRGLESRSSCHVGTLVKSFTYSCL